MSLSYGDDDMITSKIIYSINIEDVQNVAEEELGRRLMNKELKIIENKISDYIDWYSAIDTAMQNEILHCQQEEARRFIDRKTNEDLLKW
jgi:glutamyl-tRNA reductase